MLHWKSSCFRERIMKKKLQSVASVEPLLLAWAMLVLLLVNSCSTSLCRMKTENRCWVRGIKQQSQAMLARNRRCYHAAHFYTEIGNIQEATGTSLARVCHHRDHYSLHTNKWGCLPHDLLSVLSVWTASSMGQRSWLPKWLYGTKEGWSVGRH